MRKPVSIVLIALTIALVFSGCGSTPQPTATSVPATQPTATTAAAVATATQVPATTAPTLAPTTAPTTAAATVAATEEPTTAPTVAPTTAASEGIALPEVNPLEVTGAIVSAGSSTVYPLSEAIAEMFADEGYAGQVTIDSIGSGAGFERFCKDGDTDIANASRAIKDTEIESCQAIDREPVEFRIGTDAIAVVVSKENTFLTNVSMEELAKIFSSDAVLWSDVNPEWPSENILRFIPGTDSGTFDYFVEVVLEKNEEAALSASNQQASEDDNVLVQGVLGSPYSIGYFGFAYYHENADQLNVLSIDGITPDEATVDSNEYPLARPLYLYTTAQIMAEKPQVASFIGYYLTNVDSVISEVGYFPASTQALDGAKQAWLDAMAGGTGAATSATASEGIALPEVNPLEVTGAIVSAGSSTVYPLSEAIAEMFADEGYAGQVTIDSIGSGAGFERFCKDGDTDIANASRAIKDTEIESCQAIDREPVEFRIGTDAIAVVVSKENTFLTNVSMEELAKIFSSDAVLWSDVNPEWPSENILRFIPGTDSGTFDYFVEVVLEKNEEAALSASNQQASEDDNVLVQGVLGSPYSIGYFGFAYYHENADQLNVLSIDGITPDEATVDSNEYPLARPLYLYTTAQIMAEKPQVASFIGYYLTNVDSVISEVGYFPASTQALDGAKQAWLDAMGQ